VVDCSEEGHLERASSCCFGDNIEVLVGIGSVLEEREVESLYWVEEMTGVSEDSEVLFCIVLAQKMNFYFVIIIMLKKCVSLLGIF